MNDRLVGFRPLDFMFYEVTRKETYSATTSFSKPESL